VGECVEGGVAEGWVRGVRDGRRQELHRAGFDVHVIEAGLLHRVRQPSAGMIGMVVGSALVARLNGQRDPAAGFQDAAHFAERRDGILPELG
jgi:hypothetical protein